MPKSTGIPLHKREKSVQHLYKVKRKKHFLLLQ